MKSDVFFLPWNRINRFPEWVKSIGITKHVKEKEFVAVKIHFGEKRNTGYIRPEKARTIVREIKARNAFPFMTDSCTIYVGKRADAVHHTWIAAEHGFTLGKCSCPIIIADGLRGNSGVDVEVNMKHFKNVSIANAIFYADSIIFMNHFKGHEITGFGGALKNIGMGCATRAGKYAMHDRISPIPNIEKCTGCGQCIKWCSAEALNLDNDKIIIDNVKCVGCGECILSCAQHVFNIPWDENASAMQEKIVEYACGVLKNKSHFSLNFLSHITKYCDCFPDKEGPLLDDIGVLASSDPVALDQASIDMVNKNFGSDFIKHIFPDIDWHIQLDYAEKSGLGVKEYTIIE